MSTSSSSTSVLDTVVSKNIIVLHEVDITPEEEQTIYGIFDDPKLVCKVDSTYASGSLPKLCLKYPIFLIDVQKNDIKQWYLNQKGWISQNSDRFVITYKHVSGAPITQDRFKEVKTSFASNTVRKYLPVRVRDLADYRMQCSVDHVSHTAVRDESLFQKILKFLAKLLC